MAKSSLPVPRGAVGRTSPGHYEDPVSIGADGSIIINSAKLVAPENVYDADFAWLSIRHDAVSLWFGKESVDSPSVLRSRLELRYPSEGFVRHFWNGSREFHEKMRPMMTDLNGAPGREHFRPEGLKAEKDASMWVNFDYLSRSGTQASLDFYHLPPSGVARFAQGHGSAGIVATPKVRVLTTVHELFGLLNAAAAVVDQLKRTLPKGLIEDEHEAAKEA